MEHTLIYFNENSLDEDLPIVGIVLKDSQGFNYKLLNLDQRDDYNLKVSLKIWEIMFLNCVKTEQKVDYEYLKKVCYHENLTYSEPIYTFDTLKKIPSNSKDCLEELWRFYKLL